MHNPRTLVIDLDDTILITVTPRDWANAYVDKAVVQKMDDMFEDGWDIIIHTARGTLSCGSVELADKTYRADIETLLEYNGVKYTSLVFGKPLAALYVDDKATTPARFKEMSIKRIESGLSGAIVQVIGDTVAKTAPNAKAVVAWYREAQARGYQVPKILSVTGDTINMERVKGHTLTHGHYPHQIDMALMDMKRMINTKQHHQNNGDWGTYIRRVEHHIREDRIIQKMDWMITPMMYRMDNINSHLSFCHGDLTLDNMMTFSGRCAADFDALVYIDPNPMTDIFSSWTLDLSKLAMSCVLHRATRYLDQLYDFGEENGLRRTDMNTLILTHWIRMLKYVRNDNPILYGRAIENIHQLVETTYK